MNEKIDKLNENELQDLVAANDTGGRSPHGFSAKLITVVAIAWSLFQIYYSSPLNYSIQAWINELGLPINLSIDSTKARSIHLSFALLLAFLSYPAFKSSPRNRIPETDWFLAIAGCFLGAYYFLFYNQIALRPGNPTTTDIITGICGILVLFEATRRCLGLPLVIVAAIFLLFNFVGPWIADLPYPISLFAHNSNKLDVIINQQWITSEGIFGVALGASTNTVFLFVLFGALLEKAGAGNYFIQTAFSLLGHLRGGPAKAAVIASGLTGLISGSSIANVVTTGTFTVPMMRKVGFSREKAGAVEVASSVNGQIMPPVMGAAAFLMVEYVGISYFEVVKHAFLPAVISYIALFYIVHLEAMKADMKGLERANQPPKFLIRLRNFVGIILLICILSFVTYYTLGWVHTVFGELAGVVIAILVLITYILIAWWSAKFPTLVLEDPNSKIVKLPPVKETVNSGLHFLLPVVVLVWSLMVMRLSPGTSAFWSIVCLVFILITQKPLFAFFRKKGHYKAHLKEGFSDVLSGLEIGARNMIGIGIATACAGVIVGVVALTNVGAPLSDAIEFLSGGNILAMLILVGILSLILGMGLPTTANYIVVSSLMAGVIVEVGKQNGLVVPLIAVHLFVFYFGIMADVTPPVGLASFAAAAVSGGDPMKTGLIAFFYSLRTAILPILFIFNTDLLLINVNLLHGILIFIIATAAILVFTAGTQKYFFDRCNWIEVILLLAISFALFRPGFFMDEISPSYNKVSPASFVEEIGKIPSGQKAHIKIKGLDQVGDETSYFILLPITGDTAKEKFENTGLTVINTDGKVMIDDVAFDSPAQKAGFDWDQEILELDVPNPDAIAKEWLYIPVLFLLFVIAKMQIRRKKRKEQQQARTNPNFGI